MTFVKATALMGAGIILSACAVFQPERVAQECGATDWKRFGLNDGKLGVTTESRARKFDDCATVGKPVDLVAYQAGRTEGLVSYCTTENGFDVGFDGRRYRDVCPPNLEPDFLQGYDRGRKDRRSASLSPRIGVVIGSNGRIRTGVGIVLGTY